MYQQCVNFDMCTCVPDLLATLLAAELNRFKQLLLRKEQECFTLKGDLESKDQEVDDVRAAAAVSESLLKESFRDEHKQMVDEINSLKQIVKGEKSCDMCPPVRPGCSDRQSTRMLEFVHAYLMATIMMCTVCT